MTSSDETLQRLKSGAMAGATRLDLGCGLTELPDEVFTLADSLEILNLTGNQLSSLPPDLDRLHRLRVLFCSNNRFTDLPRVLGKCRQLDMVGFKANRIATVPPDALPPALRWLILTDNHIEQLPDDIGRRPALRKLMLAGNRLRELPDTLADAGNLELLRIGANRLEALPDWLMRLPRLAWLGFAGNPLSAARPVDPATAADADIPWSRLTLARCLGEGASGVIWRATWQRAPADAVEVVVKLFRSGMTSDGRPEEEIAACRRAGPHRHLVPCFGRLVEHPDGTAGLVMMPIDGAHALAGAPSLASCTRDVYADGCSFGVGEALALARAGGSAAAHLHHRGLLHGDLYAHNLMWSRRTLDVRLCDLGAASPLPAEPRTSAALQRIDVRAFGCLLQELRERLPRQHADCAAARGLQALEAACLRDEAAGRPLMADVVAALEGLRPPD